MRKGKIEYSNGGMLSEEEAYFSLQDIDKETLGHESSSEWKWPLRSKSLNANSGQGSHRIP